MKRPRDVYWGVLGEFTQTKIIQGQVVNIPLKNVDRCKTHTKISDARTIKNRWSGASLGHSMQVKIIDECYWDSFMRTKIMQR